MNPEGMAAWYYQGDGRKLWEETYAIRRRRNDLAHESAEVGWDMFEADAATIEETLAALGRHDEAVTIQSFLKTAKDLQDPGIHGKHYLTRRNLALAAAAGWCIENLGMTLILMGLCAPAFPRLLTVLKTWPVALLDTIDGYSKVE
jgi:hypothetical protein